MGWECEGISGWDTVSMKKSLGEIVRVAWLGAWVRTPARASVVVVVVGRYLAVCVQTEGAAAARDSCVCVLVCSPGKSAFGTRTKQSPLERSRPWVQ